MRRSEAAAVVASGRWLRVSQWRPGNRYHVPLLVLLLDGTTTNERPEESLWGPSLANRNSQPADVDAIHRRRGCWDCRWEIGIDFWFVSLGTRSPNSQVAGRLLLCIKLSLLSVVISCSLRLIKCLPQWMKKEQRFNSVARLTGKSRNGFRVIRYRVSLLLAVQCSPRSYYTPDPDLDRFFR